MHPLSSLRRASSSVTNFLPWRSPNVLSTQSLGGLNRWKRPRQTRQRHHSNSAHSIAELSTKLHHTNTTNSNSMQQRQRDGRKPQQHVHVSQKQLQFTHATDTDTMYKYSYPHSRSSTSTYTNKDKAEAVDVPTPTIKGLLLSLLSNANDQTHPSDLFQKTLERARNDESLLKSLRLSSSDANSMHLLPPEYLRQVHLAISHFSMPEHFSGMALDLDSQGNKLPGAVLCVKLLELLGIPFQHSTYAPSSSDSYPLLVVHSSQIDALLHCCLETTVALSKCCNPGRFSLIGHDFSSNSTTTRGETTAAHLAENIWRTVSTMQIHSAVNERTKPENAPMIRMPSLLNAITDLHNHAASDYLDAHDSIPRDSKVSWTKKDQRRYDQSLTLFNSVLAAYARLGSSATGTRPEKRRDRVQSAERLLLEVAQRKLEPSPSTLLQCLLPDVISFNTAIKAWAGLSPRKVAGGRDEYEATLATLTAERARSILEVMQDLSDEGRSNETTRNAIRAKWEECREDELHRNSEIAPNTSSYNTVLYAWARSSNGGAFSNAMKVFRNMVERCNTACSARELLLREKYGRYHGTRGKDALEGDCSFPDSRTFVALLECCSRKSMGMEFDDALMSVESIFDTMKQWNDQLQWSANRGISPVGSVEAVEEIPLILNIFTYNALIKALASLPDSWDESLLCCRRIDDVISSVMESSDSCCNADSITRGTAAQAWMRSSEFSKNDVEKTQYCVEKAFPHVDLMLRSNHDTARHAIGTTVTESRSITVHTINKLIALYGKASMIDKANELFLRARESNNININSISTIVEVLCASGAQDVTHVDMAEKYLLQFEKDTMGKNSTAVPDMNYTKLYNTVISGFIYSENKDVGRERALNLLTHMINSHSTNSRHIARPNTTSFADIMNALAKIGSTPQAEELLTKMEELDQRRKTWTSPGRDLLANVVPNIVFYNIVFKSYLRSGDLSAAEKLLDRMQNDPQIPSPDKLTYHLMSNLRGRHVDENRHSDHQRNTSSSRDVNVVSQEQSASEFPIDAESLLNMKDTELDNLILERIRQDPNPSAMTFNSIMKQFISKGTIEGAEKGDGFLRRLEEMYSAGDISVRPDIFLYNMAMHGWRQCEQNCLDRSVSPSERAQKILDSLCERYKIGDKYLSPNDFSFSICIHSWCDSNAIDAPDRAEQLLRRKEEFSKHDNGVAIRTGDYNSVISKWREDPNKGPERARVLFEEVVRKSELSENYQNPTDVALNSLLAVYAKSYNENSAEEAEGYLKRMNDLHSQGKSTILPGVVSYRSCIDAWILKKQRESPHRVEALVLDMIEKYKHEGRIDLMPDSNCLDLILKACNLAPVCWNSDGAENGHDHPINIANRTFALLRGKNEFKAKPTHSTYAFMFRIYNRHMDFRDARYGPIMRNLFLQCCRDGLVSEFTLESFRKSVTASIFLDIIGKTKYLDPESVNVGSLPREWRRNVAPKRT